MATPEELTQRRKDAIKKRMERTRARLAGRLHSLGETVHGVTQTMESVKDTVESTVETVQDTVQSTVSAVQDTVQSTVSTVQDTVQSTVETAKEVFSVRRHPLAWLGGSVVAGYLCGLWWHSRSRATSMPYPYPYAAPPPGPAYAAAPQGAPAQPAKAEGPGIGDYLHKLLGGWMDQAKGLGIGTGVGLLRDLVADQVPPTIRSEVVNLGNDLIKQLGGQEVGPILNEILGSNGAP